MHPIGVSLNEEETKAIAFLAFPDSNTGVTGDSQHSFRVRATIPIEHRFNTRPPPKRRSYYGSVYFRQVPDASVRRGYFQKAVVVLSQRPPSDFSAGLCRVVAREFFARGEPAVVAACQQISLWPSPGLAPAGGTPRDGLDMRLSLLGTTLVAHFPADGTGLSPHEHAAALALRNAEAAEGDGGLSPLLAVPGTANLAGLFRPLFMHLQLLWELMLSAEPVVVLAPTPGLASRLILALEGITAPIEYNGDSRPYFTIHDPDCQRYSKFSAQFPCAILGVTNPYFEQAFAKWPNHVRLVRPPAEGAGRSQRSKESPGRKGSDLRRETELTKTGAAAAARHSPNNPRRSRTRAGVFSQYRQQIDVDRDFMKSLILGGSTSELSGRIRAHFLELTQLFLVPLEQYMARLMPRKSGLSPFREIPTLAPFDADAFGAVLQGHLPVLGRRHRGQWATVYKRFLSSPNFTLWFSTRRRRANRELLRMFVLATARADFASWLPGKSELQIVDVCVRVRGALCEAQQHELVPPDEIEVASNKVEFLVATVPPDLQQCLAVPPGRAG